MLKKAGFIVTAVAAGVLAVGTFAFADTITNVEDSNQTNDCALDQAGSDVDQSLLGGSSLLGDAGALSGIVNTLDTQTQTGNCTNFTIEDVIDSGSNNSSETTDEVEVDDSFNVED